MEVISVEKVDNGLKVSFREQRDFDKIFTKEDLLKDKESLELRLTQVNDWLLQIADK